MGGKKNQYRYHPWRKFKLMPVVMLLNTYTVTSDDLGLTCKMKFLKITCRRVGKLYLTENLKI